MPSQRDASRDAPSRYLGLGDPVPTRVRLSMLYCTTESLQHHLRSNVYRIWPTAATGLGMHVNRGVPSNHRDCRGQAPSACRSNTFVARCIFVNAARTVHQPAAGRSYRESVWSCNHRDALDRIYIRPQFPTKGSSGALHFTLTDWARLLP